MTLVTWLYYRGDHKWRLDCT